MTKSPGFASAFLGFFLLFLLNHGFVPTAFAAAPGSVVINEVAWAGSLDNANDEWIELYNTTNQSIDLTGWKINDDQGSSLYNLSGQISPFSYYLIEDAEVVVQPNVANSIVNLSLANTGDSLVLFDQNNQIVDAVNSVGGAWYAGSSVSKASMERIDYAISGDIASNWASSLGGSGATSSSGSAILGTPGVLNTASSGGQVIPVQVSLIPSAPAVNVGDTVTVIAHITNAVDLFSYGFEIQYDPSLLTYENATQGPFLSNNGSVSTSFQLGLEDSVPGKILVAEARTQAIKTGVNGSGDLFALQFTVVGSSQQPSSFTFNPGSFLSSPVADIPSQLLNTDITIVDQQVNPVTNFLATQGVDRYSISLSWTGSVGGADAYKIYRQNPHGSWVFLGQVANPQTGFVDNDTVNGGGKIVPQLQYHYRVVALKGANESVPTEIFGVENRGLKGDNDRSDRVDGRDLEKLAQNFTALDIDAGFNPLVDTTYDGEVDGSDLIDLGANFAKTYS